MSSSSFVDATAGAVEHCESMAQQFPELATVYQSMGYNVAHKLWHQLTITLLEFVSTPQNARMMVDGSTHSFLVLMDKVVLSSNIAKRLNPLSLARVAVLVATALVSHDGTAAKAVLENLLEKKDTLGVSATIYVQSKLILLRILLEGTSLLEDDDDDKEVAVDIISDDTAPAPTKSLKRMIQETIRANAKLLEEMQFAAGDITTVNTEAAMVHSAHYEMSMTYYKAVGPPEAFYEACMSYLNYTPMEKIENVRPLAVDLCLAALTGDGVYNLGQVVSTPIVGLLDETDPATGVSYQWLLQLLKACSSGNVTDFQQVSTTHSADIQRQPALVHRAAAVQEKLTLLALVNMVFERPSAERTLGFAEIAQRVQLTSIDQVELVVMRAFSVGLLQGYMDQVDQTVQVTHVVPRVLTRNEMQDLSQRYGEWAQKVNQTKGYMQQQTAAFISS
jgi:26S proteasome regulatory subunit N9